MSVSRLARCAAGLAVLLAVAFAHAAGVSIPNPEASLDTDMAALLHKEKAKQNIYNEQRRNKYKAGELYNSDDAETCGNVSINSNNQPPGNGGVGNILGRPNVTIVTGPVINAANCR